MRHRNVFMPALFQVPLQVQKARWDTDSLGFVETVLLQAMLSFLKACIWRSLRIEGSIFEVTLGRRKPVVR